VLIDNLPLCLDDASVCARVNAAPSDDAATGHSATPLARDLRVVLRVPQAARGLAPAEDEALEAVVREEATLRATIDDIEEEIDDLAALEILPRASRGTREPPAASPTTGRLALLELRAERQRELTRERDALRRSLREVERRHVELADRQRREVTAKRAAEHELRKALLVHLDATAVTVPRVTLEIDYMVPGASWAPSYTMRMDPQLRRFTLAMRALVAQHSGEDWSAVALTLSTADAERREELPELSSLRIGRRRVAPLPRGFREPPSGAAELFADYDRAIEALAPAPKGKPLFGDADDLPLDQTASLRTPTRLQAAFVAGVAGGGVTKPAAAPQQAVDAVAPVSSAAPPPPGLGLAEELLARAAPAKRKRALFDLALPEGALDGRVRLEQKADVASPPRETPLFDYGKLRLAPAHESGRGQLVLADERTLYLELVVHHERVVAEGALDAIADERRRAERIDATRLPPRHRLAWSDAYAYAYTCEARLDVPSDGNFHSLPVVASEGRAALSYVVVPRESTDAFRVARLANPLPAPLLAGPVDVYVGEHFLMTTDATFTVPGGELSLGLGVEQGIKVARNARFQEQSTGIIGGSLSLEHDVTIDVANQTGQRADLEIRERMPVVNEGEDDIKIELRRVEPEWEPFDPFPSRAEQSSLRGGRRWRLSLDGGERRRLYLAYAVRIAAKHELVGGNRRE
jgi:hypothetical protein